MTSLPDLSELEKLIELNLFRNEIPSTYKFPKLASLEKLDLSANKLTSLPDLSELEKLAELNLSWNKIPSTYKFPKLANLEKLDLIR